MNETIITHELLTYLRSKLRGPVVKLADKGTIGLPDATVTSGGTTQWIEIKLVKVGPRTRTFDLRKIVGFGKPQSRMMGLLDLHGRAWYVIFFTEGVGRWKTLACGAVTLANLCNQPQATEFYFGTHLEGLVTEGKDFERVLTLLRKNMRESL